MSHAARARCARLLARSLLVVGGLLLPLVCLELALRLFGPILPGNYLIGAYLVHHPVYGSFHPRNSVVWYHTNEFVTRLHFSEQGLRGPDVPHAKPSGTFRILILGDSLADAVQVPQETRFSELMQDRFTAEYGAGRVQVVNAAVSGWSTAQEVRYFEDEGRLFQPDLVLLMVYPTNDIGHNSTTREEPGQARDRPYFALREGQDLELLAFEPHTADTGERLDRLARRTVLLYDVMQYGVLGKSAQDVDAAQKASITDVYRVKGDSRFNYGWKVTAALFHRLRDAVATSGSLVIVGVPARWQVLDDEWRKMLADFRLKPAKYAPQRPVGKLAKAADAAGLPSLDLYHHFRSEVERSTERLYFSDDPHWTPAGHQVAADALYTFLVDNNLVARLSGS